MEDLLRLDDKYSHKAQIPSDRTGLKKAAAFLAHSGDSWFWGAGLVLLWFVGPKPWRPYITLLFLGIVSTAFCVMILKFTIKRPRPEGEWGQIYRNSDPHAFPSGHAARGAMLSVIMLLSGLWWIGLILVAWTILVDLSRVGLGVHYFSDILGGTLIGIVMGGLAFWIFNLL
jgi:membrane-associated phospholipid phosphatase